MIHKPLISSLSYTQYVSTRAHTIEVLDIHYNYHEIACESMPEVKILSLLMLKLQVHAP